MGLTEEGLDDVWGSDYVQKNPNKAYKVSYDTEYTAVASFLNGGAEPNFANFSKLGKGLCKIEKQRRLDDVVIPPVEPPPVEPPVPTPSGTKLTWAPPALSSPITKTLTDSARTIGTGSGQDLKVLAPTRLTGQIGQVQGYNDIAMIGGEIIGGDANTSGHIVPRKNTGTFHIEGWKIELSVYADVMSIRERTNIIQVENCKFTATDAGTDYHADCIQTQIAVFDELRIDRCTFTTDYQGIVLINEYGIPSAPENGQWDKVIVRRTQFKRGALDRGMWFFLCWPSRDGLADPGIMELYDVWAPDDDGTIYPWTDFKSWKGGSHKRGIINTTKVHPVDGKTYKFRKFSTPNDVVPTGTFAGQACEDCKVRGDGGVWIGTPPASLNVGCDANVGKDYVSPGYI